MSDRAANFAATPRGRRPSFKVGLAGRPPGQEPANGRLQRFIPADERQAQHRRPGQAKVRTSGLSTALTPVSAWPSMPEPVEGYPGEPGPGDASIEVAA